MLACFTLSHFLNITYDLATVASPCIVAGDDGHTMQHRHAASHYAPHYAPHYNHFPPTPCCVQAPYCDLCYDQLSRHCFMYKHNKGSTSQAVHHKICVTPSPFLSQAHAIALLKHTHAHALMSCTAARGQMRACLSSGPTSSPIFVPHVIVKFPIPLTPSPMHLHNLSCHAWHWQGHLNPQ